MTHTTLVYHIEESTAKWNYHLSGGGEVETYNQKISVITGHLPHFTEDDTQPREKIQLPLAFVFPTY